MIFGIITHAVHKIKGGQIYAYEPYVREMNLWGKYIDEIIIISPVSTEDILDIETPYLHKNIRIIEIPNFDITSFQNLIKSVFVIPKICILIFRVMKQSTQIHLRCPGNIGLLGCIVQIFFPNKYKTAKYAGNWDPNSNQPFTYRLQKKILSNVFLTKKMKVMAYGNWPNQTKNIIPFFTATYSKKEIEVLPIKTIRDAVIKFIFVGGLTNGKQPILSVKVIHELIKQGKSVELNIYGDGIQRKELENYIKENKLEEYIFLHGNVSKDVVKLALQKSHFMLFISKSEGWPKAVAEAMFWGCVPITTKVSCVPYMLNNGERGSLVLPNVNDIIKEILNYYITDNLFETKAEKAKLWSQKFTLEKFEKEIEKLLNE